MGMHVDRRGFRHARCHAGNSDQYPGGSIWQRPGALNLAELARGTIIDQSPEQTPQASPAGPAVRLPGPGLRLPDPRLEMGNLRANLVREVGLEPALKHLSACEIP